MHHLRFPCLIDSRPIYSNTCLTFPLWSYIQKWVHGLPFQVYSCTIPHEISGSELTLLFLPYTWNIAVLPTSCMGICGVHASSRVCLNVCECICMCMCVPVSRGLKLTLGVPLNCPPQFVHGKSLSELGPHQFWLILEHKLARKTTRLYTWALELQMSTNLSLLCRFWGSEPQSSHFRASLLSFEPSLPVPYLSIFFFFFSWIWI